MTGKDIKMLRHKAQMSQAEMAKVLQISHRTIAKWETEKDNDISPVYTNVCRTILENIVIVPVLRHCVDRVFEKIPSEFVGIWLVRYSLFPIESLEKIILPLM